MVLVAAFANPVPAIIINSSRSGTFDAGAILAFLSASAFSGIVNVLTESVSGGNPFFDTVLGFGVKGGITAFIATVGAVGGADSQTVGTSQSGQSMVSDRHLADAEKLLINLQIDILGRKIGALECRIQQMCTKADLEEELREMLQVQQQIKAVEKTPKGTAAGELVTSVLGAAGLLEDAVAKDIKHQNAICAATCGDSSLNPIIPEARDKLRRDVFVGEDVIFKGITKKLNEIVNRESQR